jgi:hypothetical protein
VNSQQAFAQAAGQAVWNSPAAGFGNSQGAAFTFANTTLNDGALMLKATGGFSTQSPSTFLRVRYDNGGGGQVVLESTTFYGLSYTQLGTLTGTFANGDTLSVVANADGSVDVWKTSGASTTYLGNISTTFTGTGRIGIQLPPGGRVDNFSGGNLP